MVAPECRYKGLQGEKRIQQYSPPTTLVLPLPPKGIYRKAIISLIILRSPPLADVDCLELTQERTKTDPKCLFFLSFFFVTKGTTTPYNVPRKEEQEEASEVLRVLCRPYNAGRSGTR